MIEEITPRGLAAIFDERCIGPDSEYTAAAGQDYGYVAAWELPDGGYLISYGDNSTTSHALAEAEDADDLACWLESPDLDSLSTILQTANIRGLEAVEEADEADEGPFAVLVTRQYYGPTASSRFADDDYGQPREFETYADAEAWIADQDDHEIGHNESGAPTYTIVAG